MTAFETVRRPVLAYWIVRDFVFVLCALSCAAGFRGTLLHVFLITAS